MSDWESDYEDMVKEMFYGDAPAFDEILKTIKEFQDQFNAESCLLPLYKFAQEWLYVDRRFYHLVLNGCFELVIE